MESKKGLFLNVIRDAVSIIFYYGRKDDEDLSVSDVDELIDNGEVTFEEIVKTFSDEIKNNISFPHKP